MTATCWFVKLRPELAWDEVGLAVERCEPVGYHVSLKLSGGKPRSAGRSAESWVESLERKSLVNDFPPASGHEKIIVGGVT
jgi:hypothetical protein